MNGRLPAARFVAVLAGVWLLFVAAVYLPDIGRGFVKDDFVWIEAGRAALADPVRVFVPDTPGFYRPIVSLSFAVDYLVHGLAARGYGFSNLALFLGCVAALWMVCRRIGLSSRAAAVATLAWSANPHGINMALVWISGRTALWLTLFALLAAWAIVQRRYAWTALFLSAALASKEEALALPAILFVWHELLAQPTLGERRSRRAAAAALGLPTVAYLLVRYQTAAFTPASAPPYYQFTFAPATVLANALAYLDRSATLSLVVSVLACAAYRMWPALTPERRRQLAACAVWFAGGCALTVFLPARSSLYAVFPSVGAAIASGAVVESLWTAAAPARRPLLPLEAVLALSLVAALPIYRARNDRFVEPARLSQRALQVIANETAQIAGRGAIVLHDVDDPTSSFVSAFGTLATDAVRLCTGRDVQVWIEPPPPDWTMAGLTRPDRRSVVACFAVDHGRVFRRE